MPVSEALVAALIEIEQHVGRLGWDQPARLFALVPTADLLAAEPSLRRETFSPEPGAFSAIEQEEFRPGEDLGETLAGIGWPDAVAGCALAVERAFLPAGAEEDLPPEPQAAALVVAAHPQRLDLRVVVGVTRTGERHGVARVKSSPEDLLGGEDLVPALASALAHTLD